MSARPVRVLPAVVPPAPESQIVLRDTRRPLSSEGILAGIDGVRVAPVIADDDVVDAHELVAATMLWDS